MNRVEYLSNLTPEPHHIPGYSGFTPQTRYRYGNTFSATTSNILRDPYVSTSGKTVLSELSPPLKNQNPLSTQDMEALQLKNRKESWGSQKVTDVNIPGYTGQIPTYQRQFGKSFNKSAISAMCGSLNEREKFKQPLAAKTVSLTSLKPQESNERYKGPAESLNQWDYSSIGKGKCDCSSTKAANARCENDGLRLPDILDHPPVPLKQQRAEALPYVSKSLPKPTLSPYAMNDCDPDKRFISDQRQRGYMGFVPRAQNQFGQAFDKATHQALNEFTHSDKMYRQRIKNPVCLRQVENNTRNFCNSDTKQKQQQQQTAINVREFGGKHNGGGMEQQKVYHPCEGMIPRYQGHVPGEKFDFGQSYTASTAKVLRQRPGYLSASCGL